MGVLLKKKSGGSSIGDYVWDKDGDVVEVDDEFANELLAISPDDFSVADDKPAAKKTAAKKSAAAKVADDKPAADADGDDKGAE